MKSCAYGSILGASALVVAFVGGACRAERPVADIPPVTVARVEAPSDASVQDASVDGSDAAAATKEPPAKVAFVDLPATVPASVCERVLVAVTKGKITALGETLGPGDVLVVANGEPFEAKGGGLAVTARTAVVPCPERARPAAAKTVVRASAAPELRFAGGKMAAHLDVGTKVSPSLYLGRLEGTAAVPEHNHPTSWEIIAAVEASGTFVLEGKEARLGPRQVVYVPAGAKHAWRPDPGSKLVAIQMYAPPGPEQRFVALAAATQDGGAPMAKPDAGATPKPDAGAK